MLNPSSEMISRMEMLLDRVQAQQEEKPKVIELKRRPGQEDTKVQSASAAK